MKEAAPVTLLTGLRAATPMLLGVVLALCSLMPLGDATGSLPAPHLTLVHVYYWSIHRPQLVPPLAVAVLGLFQDLLWGGPPGLNMLVLLAAQSVLSNQQALFTRRSFAVGWGAFITVAAIAAAVSWIVGSLYYDGQAALRPLVEQALLTIAVYPLLGWVFGRIDRILYR